jgi:hypothetical protein
LQSYRLSISERCHCTPHGRVLPSSRPSKTPRLTHMRHYSVSRAHTRNHFHLAPTIELTQPTDTFSLSQRLSPSARSLTASAWSTTSRIADRASFVVIPANGICESPHAITHRAASFSMESIGQHRVSFSLQSCQDSLIRTASVCALVTVELLQILLTWTLTNFL